MPQIAAVFCVASKHILISRSPLTSYLAVFQCVSSMAWGLLAVLRFAPFVFTLAKDDVHAFPTPCTGRRSNCGCLRLRFRQSASGARGWAAQSRHSDSGI